MLSQIVVHTNAHPYHVQVISFWFSVGPVAAILLLLVFVWYWNAKRNSRRRAR